MNIAETLKEYNLTPDKYEELLKDCSDKVNKVKDIDWSEINDKYQLSMNPDTIRKGSQPPLFGGIFVSEYFKEKHMTENASNSDTYVKEIATMKRDLEKERIKIHTEKLEYNKWLREEARDEMIRDEMVRAISNLKPLEIPEYIAPVHNTKSYLLTLADAHYGIEFEIKDLFGDTINEYSPEIFEECMWDLLNQTIEIIRKEKIDTLYVWELGDGLQGILRLNSQLMKLRYGIIDSSILYANFLAEWLNVLSKHVRVNFQMVTDSNHNQLRLVNAPKNAFPEENMSKSMLVLIKERLKNNPNIKIVENPTGMNYSQIGVWNCLGIHGEVKDPRRAIDEFSRAYQLPIDYLIMGHEHHLNCKEVSKNGEVLGVRSIIGVDPYGMSLRRTSDAGASLFVFEQLKGKVAEYSLKV